MALSHSKSVFSYIVLGRWLGGKGEQRRGSRPNSHTHGRPRTEARAETSAESRTNIGEKSQTEARPSGFGTGKFEAALVITFAVLALIGLLHHELWRDEVQAWLLAINSPTLIDLFRNMRTEGHPGLWHLCLYGLAHLSRHPLTMQLFHLAIAVTNVCLIARFAPFNRLQKGLLTFGYFTFFEYAIISRSYGLGLFFVLLFCCLYPRYLRRPNLLPFIALGLLANTSLHGLLLSIALSIPLLWPSPRRSLQSGRSTTGRSVTGRSITGRSTIGRLIHWRTLAAGTSVLLAGWLTCYAQIIRAAPGNSALNLARSAASEHESWTAVVRPFLRSIALIWRSYFPIPKVWGDRVWGENILTDIRYSPSYEGISVALLASFALSLLLIAFVVILLWSRPKLLTAYCIGTLSLLAFSHYVFLGSIRHHGHLFILLLACLWLAKLESRYLAPGWLKRRSPSHLATLSSWLWKLHGPFWTFLLMCHFFGGSALYSIDLMHPFSASRDTAEFLRSHHLDHYPIVGYDDRYTSTLSAYLDQPIYYPNQGQFSSFWETTSVITPTEATRAIVSFVSQQSQPVVLVLSFAINDSLPELLNPELLNPELLNPELLNPELLTPELLTIDSPKRPESPASIQITPLARIESRIVREESFRLYLAQSGSASSSAHDESVALMAQ